MNSNEGSWTARRSGEEAEVTPENNIPNEEASNNSNNRGDEEKEEDEVDIEDPEQQENQEPNATNADANNNGEPDGEFNVTPPYTNCHDNDFFLFIHNSSFYILIL